MTFEMRKLNQQTWSIQDDLDQTVFSGSIDACRNWLDCQEGNQQRTFLQMIGGWFQSNKASQSQLAAPSQSNSGVLS